MRTLFSFRADHSFLASKRTFIMFQALDPRHQPYFALLLLWDSGVGVPFGPLPPARLSFGQHVALCCHLPPTGGGSESRGTISPAERPAGVEGPGATAAARGGRHYSRAAPAVRFPSPAVRFPLTCGGGAFPAPELSAWGTVPGRPSAAGSGSARWRRARVAQVAASAAGRAMEHVTEGSWESLPVPLHPRVLGALRELGFPYMTPVQVAGGASSLRGRRGKAGSEPAGSAFGRTPWGFHSSSRAFRHGFGLPRLGDAERVNDSGRQRRLASHPSPPPPSGAGTCVPGPSPGAPPSSCQTSSKWLTSLCFISLLREVTPVPWPASWGCGNTGDSVGHIVGPADAVIVWAEGSVLAQVISLRNLLRT